MKLLRKLNYKQSLEGQKIKHSLGVITVTPHILPPVSHLSKEDIDRMVADAEKFNRKSIAQFFGSLEEDRANTKIELIKNLYGYHKGALTNPVDGFVAKSLAGLRHILTSAQLGSASVVALTDFNWSRATSAHNGLPQWRTAQNSLKLLFDPLNKSEKAFANKKKLIIVDLILNNSTRSTFL